MKRIVLYVIFTLITLSSCLSEEIKPKIGLVLSGGGAKGIAHIGVLKVLEEYGIQPDYITGTSMGSIIGSLYSIGYTASELEEMVLAQDWDAILFDKLPRTSISLEEKADEFKYIGTFPLEKLKISLPAGMVSGQNVSQLLTRLMHGFHEVTDFTLLPIPFLCIATDIETGEAIVLDHGYLPEAVRASMSIPSMFTPVEIDGRLLVDGGLARNFPVGDCRALGADYIIGVDVSTGLHPKEELNSLVKIMEQSISLYGAQSLVEARELTDLLITPPVGDYSITAFNSASELIRIGEKEARKQIDKIAELAGRIETSELIVCEKPQPSDEYFISSIKVHGLEKVSKNLIIGKIRLRENTTVTQQSIDLAITQLYGSRYFNRVVYKLIEEDEGYILDISVEEKKTNVFRAGLHYDNDMKASVLLNATFRNLFVEGSKLSLDMKLGDTRSFRWSEFVHTGLRPGFGLRSDLYYDQFNFIYRSAEGTKIASLDIDKICSTTHFMTIFSDNMAIGTAVDIVFVHTKGDIIPEEWGELDDRSQWLRNSIYLKVDSRDSQYHTKQGTFLYLEAKWFNGRVSESVYDPKFLRIFLDGEKVFPISKKTSLALGGFIGLTDTDNIPVEEAFYLGGFTDKDNGRPFVGFYFAEVAAEKVYTFRSRLQHELSEGMYLTFRFDSGRIIRDFIMQESQDFWMNGWGVSFGIDTPIGPIEITSMNNDQSDSDDRYYINIGYVF